MRAAPAVSVVCQAGAGWRAFNALVMALALTALCAWALGHLQQAVWPALAVWPIVSGVAWWQGPRASTELSWDGQCWRAAGRESSLDVMVDLGSWMLLRLRATSKPDATLWLPASQASAGPPLWPALRAAVFCRTPPKPAPSVQSSHPVAPSD